jgi:hypothetical protein
MRRDGTCMIGLEFAGQYYGPCTHDKDDCHHITTRGAGGEDVKENLIRVCRGHHDLAKTGKIPPIVFRRILQKRYGYHYDRLDC